MIEMTKRELVIANMKLQTENARQAAKIRELERRLENMTDLATRYQEHVRGHTKDEEQCTCAANRCANTVCKGGCGCVACLHEYQDYGHI